MKTNILVDLGGVPVVIFKVHPVKFSRDRLRMLKSAEISKIFKGF